MKEKKKKSPYIQDSKGRIRFEGFIGIPFRLSANSRKEAQEIVAEFKKAISEFEVRFSEADNPPNALTFKLRGKAKTSYMTACRKRLTYAQLKRKSEPLCY